MDVLISRQGVIDALCDNCDNVQSVCPHYPCKQYTAINALPSAQTEVTEEEVKEYCHKRCLTILTNDYFHELLFPQPERKKGKWICHDEREGFLIPKYSCSVCDYYSGTKRTNFCPNCGTDMRGENR